eukprot:gene6132-20730_t
MHRIAGGRAAAAGRCSRRRADAGTNGFSRSDRLSWRLASLPNTPSRQLRRSGGVSKQR